jgi:hypothetical protein
LGTVRSNERKLTVLPFAHLRANDRFGKRCHFNERTSERKKMLMSERANDVKFWLSERKKCIEINRSRRMYTKGETSVANVLISAIIFRTFCQCFVKVFRTFCQCFVKVFRTFFQRFINVSSVLWAFYERFVNALWTFCERFMTVL